MRHIFKFAVLLLGISLVFTSCENKDDTLPDVGSKMEFVTVPLAIDNSIEFLWYKVRGASSYDFQISTVSDFSSVAINLRGLRADHYTANGMSYNTPYYYRIRANYADGSAGEWVAPAEPVVCEPAAIQVLSYPAINPMNGSDATFKIANYQNLLHIDITDSLTGDLVQRVPIDEVAKETGEIVVYGLPHSTVDEQGRIIDSLITYKATMFVSDGSGGEVYAANSRGFQTFVPHAVNSVSGFQLRYPRFQWALEFPVTRVAVFAADSVTLLAERVLTPDDIAAGQITLDEFVGLQLNTPYVGVAYNDDESFDYLKTYMPKVFQVLPDAPRATIAEIKRDIDESWAGRVIQIKAGTAVKFGNYSLRDKDTLTLKGESTTNRSIVNVGEKDSIILSGNNNLLVFENIQFQTDAATFSNLVFAAPDKSAAHGTGLSMNLKKILFKNCVFKNIQSPFKIAARGTLTIDTVMYDQCIYWFNKASTEGSGGLVGRIGGAGSFKRLIINNSTIVGLVGHMVKRELMSGGQKVIMTQSTIFDFRNIADEVIRANGGVNYIFFANNIFAGAVKSGADGDGKTQDDHYEPDLVYRGANGNVRPIITNASSAGQSGYVNPTLADREGWNNYCTGDFMLNGTKTSWEGSYASASSAGYGIAAPNVLKKFDEDMNAVTSERMFVAPIVTDVQYLNMGFVNPEHEAHGVGDPRWLGSTPPAPLPADNTPSTW